MKHGDVLVALWRASEGRDAFVPARVLGRRRGKPRVVPCGLGLALAWATRSGYLAVVDGNRARKRYAFTKDGIARVASSTPAGAGNSLAHVEGCLDDDSDDAREAPVGRSRLSPGPFREERERAGREREREGTHGRRASLLAW